MVVRKQAFKRMVVGLPGIGSPKMGSLMTPVQENCRNPLLGCSRKLGSMVRMVRINGLFHLLINGIY